MTELHPVDYAYTQSKEEDYFNFLLPVPVLCRNIVLFLPLARTLRPSADNAYTCYFQFLT
jgi:hypothetical protein